MSEATWEPKFQRWSMGPGKTEEEKRDHAVAAIRKAIDADAKLSAMTIEVLATGSYANRTHIPIESDVDAAVINHDYIISEWDFVDPQARSNEVVRKALMAEAGLRQATYRYPAYKDDVGATLVARFGPPPAVKRGDKAFDIHENTYRVESDCLAAFEYRLWQRNAAGRLAYHSGTWFRCDSGKEIFNYPKQQHDNGVSKHDRTGQRFKKLVRIVKNLRVEMEDAGIAAAKPIPSFLIESLVYRVPDNFFRQSSFYAELRLVLAYIASNTSSDAKCADWNEENDIKRLFHRDQPWTRQEANAFALAAWSHVGFE